MKTLLMLLMTVLLVGCMGTVEKGDDGEQGQERSQGGDESESMEKEDNEAMHDKREEASEAKEDDAEEAEVAVADDAKESDDTDTFAYESGTLGWNAGKIVGGDHGGTVDIKSATAVMDGESLVSASFEMDMTTIASDSGGLDKHLKNEDFFDVEKHPTATLTLDSAVATDKADVYTLTGDLEIMGKSNPITFLATVKDMDGKVSAQAEFTIDRTLWGITYGSGKFFQDMGDKAIRDDIEFAVDVTLAAE